MIFTYQAQRLKWRQNRVFRGCGVLPAPPRPTMPPPPPHIWTSKGTRVPQVPAKPCLRSWGCLVLATKACVGCKPPGPCPPRLPPGHPGPRAPGEGVGHPPCHPRPWPWWHSTIGPSWVVILCPRWCCGHAAELAQGLPHSPGQCHSSTILACVHHPVVSMNVYNAGQAQRAFQATFANSPLL